MPLGAFSPVATSSSPHGAQSSLVLGPQPPLSHSQSAQDVFLELRPMVRTQPCCASAMRPPPPPRPPLPFGTLLIPRKRTYDEAKLQQQYRGWSYGPNRVDQPALAPIGERNHLITIWEAGTHIRLSESLQGYGLTRKLLDELLLGIDALKATAEERHLSYCNVVWQFLCCFPVRWCNECDENDLYTETIDDKRLHQQISEYLNRYNGRLAALGIPARVNCVKGTIERSRFEMRLTCFSPASLAAEKAHD